MASSNAVYYWHLEFQDHTLLVSGKTLNSGRTSPRAALTGLKSAHANQDRYLR